MTLQSPEFRRYTKTCHNNKTIPKRKSSKTIKIPVQYLTTSTDIPQLRDTVPLKLNDGSDSSICHPGNFNSEDST